MAALTNAERQRRWRERHRAGDLLPPFDKSAAPGQPNVTPPGVTLDAIENRPVAINDGKHRRAEVLAVRPCPFCGGVPSVQVSTFRQTWYLVSCSKCGAKPPYCRPKEKEHTAEDLQTALDLWNRRPGL